MLRDDKGKEVPARYLFAHVIRYLKNHLLSALVENTKINNEEIHWVLPVPAIWKNSAKQFMKQAAEEVKIYKTHNVFMCVINIDVSYLKR